MSKELATTQGSAIVQPKGWKGLIEPELIKFSPMFLKVAPKQFGGSINRLNNCFNVAARKTPALLECELKSIVLSLAQSAAIGILPNTPTNQAYLIPYGKECQLQISYPGLITLAMRTGVVASVKGVAVYKNDFFEIHEGSEAKVVHRPAVTNRGGDADIIGAYGIIFFKDGPSQFRWLDRDQLDKRRAMSKGKSGPWFDWYKEMVEKTGVKYVLRQCSLSDSDSSERLMLAVNHDDRSSIGEPIDATPLDGFDELTAPASSMGTLAEKAAAQ
jgi:recombination protein RecT